MITLMIITNDFESCALFSSLIYHFWLPKDHLTIITMTFPDFLPWKASVIEHALVDVIEKVSYIDAVCEEMFLFKELKSLHEIC